MGAPFPRGTPIAGMGAEGGMSMDSQSRTEVLDFISEPESVAATGCTLGFLTDLTLKTIHLFGESTAQKICSEVRLPFTHVMDQVFDYLKREGLAMVTGGQGFSEQSFRYVLTAKGAERAQEAVARSHYVGPAPVPLAVYNQVVRALTIDDVKVTPASIKASFAHLVLNDVTLGRVGPAINSGHSVFIYGPPGSGKSTIAEASSRLLTGHVLVPYAIDAGGHIIRVYDPQNHQAVPDDEPAAGALVTPPEGKWDQRWVRCRRPMVVTGGEMTLADLDLIYEETAKYYEAPLQVKANGGMLVIDDFGRQQVRPFDLLNRWMVPLERRVDFFTLHTGMKIEVTFDMLLVFSTNLAPKDLVDEAFLRRIRHKVYVGNPTSEQFRLVLQRVCEARGVQYTEHGCKYLIDEHYIKAGREMRGVHPRDLVEQLIDIARYNDQEPALSRELIDEACNSYFVEM